MADEHDQAMQWAQANPNDPRSQHIMAKAWASKNPTDPRAAQILQKLAQPTGGTRHPQPGDEEYETSNAKEQDSQTALPGRVGTGLLAGTGIATAGAGLGIAVPATAAASLAKQKLQGQDFSVGQTAADVGMNAVLPAGIGKLGKWLGIGADKAQQTAMGMKKFSPGVGTEAIENGVRGTRSGMQSAMGDALDSQGGKLDKMIGGLKGEVDAESVANRVADFGQKNVSSGGYSTEAGLDRAQDAMDRGTHIYQRGNMPFTDANQVAKTAYNVEGYSPNNTPKMNYQSQLARQEAGGIRDQIKAAGDAQGVPVGDQYKTVSNLLQGAKGLSTQESLNNPLKGVFSKILDNTVTSGPVMSYGAAGANAVGKGLTSTAGKAAPTLLQLLSGNKDN